MKFAKNPLIMGFVVLLIAAPAFATWTGNAGDQKISYFPGPSDFTSQDAKIVAYGASDLYAVWVQGKASIPREVFFSKSTDNGATWTGSAADQEISANDGEGVLVSLEKPADLAVNSLGHIFVVWAESLTNQGYEIMMVKSTDGGSSWEHSSSDFPISFIGGPKALEPAIAIDNDDGLHVVWHQQQIDGVAEIYYGYSSDGGDTWTSQSADHMISFPDANPGFLADIAVDGDNNVYVVWREYTIEGDAESAAIHYGKKLAGESNFSSETADYTACLPHRSVTAPSIKVGPDNSIHVAYEVSTYDGDIYQGVILYTMSSDGGATWTGQSEEKVVDEGVGDGYSARDPDIVVTSAGDLAVCYGWYGEYPHTEPRVSLSTDNGVTWSGNTGAEIVGHWQSSGDNRPGYVPRMCVSAGNYLNVVWEEDCNDEGGSSGYYEIMYSRGDVLAGPPPPPYVLSTSPGQNDLNVDITTGIAVTFSTDMDEATINSSTFVVNGRSTGLLDGTISYDGPSRTATFDPAEDFAYGEVISITLTAGIQSSGGDPLESSYEWSFSTTVIHGIADFAPQVEYLAGDGTWSVFSADFENDGDIDLVAANAYSNNCSVLLNSGDGTFAPATNYNVGEEPWSVTAADLDADDAIDLATANLSSNDVSILKGNGDGTFAAQTAYSVIGEGPLSVTSADLDGDGDLDLVTADLIGGTVTVLRNNGSGSFSSQSSYPAGDSPVSVVAADLDGDADFDIATANYSYNNITVLLNNGDGTFAAFTPYPAGDTPLSITAADVDADGDLDLMASNCYTQDISVFLNDGDGTFASAVAYGVGECPWSVKACDLDNDGDLDLVACNEFTNDVSMLLNNGDGTFAAHIDFAVGNEPYSVFGADLDGDGDIDLATANHGTSVSVLINLDQEAPSEFAYLEGDANMYNEYVDVGNPLTGPWRVGGDVTFLVNYFDIESGNQPCLIFNPNNTDDYPGGPVNGYYFASADATGEGFVTGGDVSRLVAYFGGNAEVKWYGWDKPDPQNYYPPLWLNNRGSGLEQPVPPLDELPDGWPNCGIMPPGVMVLPSSSPR